MTTMRAKQTGSALVFTLIMLLALLFGSVATFKSSEATSMISGNMVFKGSTLSATDVALADASTFLAGQTIAQLDVSNGRYFATQRKTDTSGIVCSRVYNDASNCTVADATWGAPIQVGNVQVFYVIDRLCKATPGLDITKNCLVERQFVSDDHSVGEGTTNVMQDAVFYRVTVRSVGANNTESFVQITMPRSTT